MVLVQVLINNANNGTYFAVPVTGKCCIRVLGVQYQDATAIGRVLQVQSDNLYFPYSPQRYLTFMTGAPTAATSAGYLQLDVSNKEYHLKDQVLAGQLLLTVVQLSSLSAGALPNSFQCLISLEVEKIDEEFQR